MKLPLLLTFLCFVTNYSFSQPSVSEMKEREFFDYLNSLSKSHYQNQGSEMIIKEYSLRADLLKKLESYLIVFVGDSIAPMYLEDSTDKQASSVYVKEYYDALVKVKDKHESRSEVQKGKFINIRNLLLELCDLNKPNNDAVEMYIAEFEHPFTLEYLYYVIKESFIEGNETNSLSKLPKIIQEQNLKLIASRMNTLDKANYMYYENYNSKSNFLKGFEMYHDNDVFNWPFQNQDRELTGGFKFTIVTDYLKWRWFRIGNKEKDNVLSYQTISLVGSGYTPYIRYRNNDELADSLHNYDRPFASFLCLERAKHRTWKKGLVRHKGEFQIGAMGISEGRKIQAKLHEDVITSSQFVHGWDKQIANGGRLVLQLNHKVDFLLYSNTNRYITVFNRNHFLIDEPKRKLGCIKSIIYKNWCKHDDACQKYGGGNLIGEVEAKVGTIMTTVGAGIRFSTLDFLKQSGNQMIMSRGSSKDEFGWKFDIGFNYRYVVHNSLLEGMGLFKTFNEDPYDKVLPDNHILEANEIKRNMFILDYGLSLRSRKTTVFFRQNFHTLEYRSRLSSVDFQSTNITSTIDPKDIEYYNNTVTQEQNSFLNNKIFGKQIYGFGTLGISWIIE